MHEKYLHRIVTIIYQDRNDQLTQRRIRVQSIADGRVRAYDLGKQAPRVFDAARILAVQPEAQRA